MPIKASELAGQVDDLYIFLIIISVIGIIFSIGAMIYLVYRYKRKTASDKTAYITHNHTLEFIWSFIPFIAFMAAFFWGYKVYSKIRHIPKNAYEVQVTGQKWSWSFTYKDGFTVGKDLVVPVGKPIKLLMTSRDVIHSFFVPSFRNKMDVVPGKYTLYGFKATKEGTYDLFCTEFCGTKHSGMIGSVIVKSQADFDAWIKKKVEAEKALGSDPVLLLKKGEELYTNGPCKACHTLDGTPATGPTFKGLFGKKREFFDGSSAIADENYLRESILLSNAKIVKGFGDKSSMPVFQGSYKDNEINALIEFIKSIK
ncbi:MAG: cytochrome c oxidase subunit II [Spirochaetota bacterium]